MPDLVTSDEYKDYQGITSSTNDSKLSVLTGHVSDLIKNYCGRTFCDWYNVTKTEYFDTTKVNKLYTVEWPINTTYASTEVAYSKDGGVTYTALVKNTDYYLDEDGIRADYSGLINFLSSNLFKGIRVKYRGGYDSINVPKDLKLATYDLITYYLRKEQSPRKSIGDTSVEHVKSTDFPPHIKRVLDLYRNME
ncbi:MAG TPA: hypothetical protein EYP92_06830 [Candidatus Thioglobus sp.]|jgi:hypothetical protein|nr:hypothetical protein [Candidatus Thioglobus sp.]